MDVSSITKNIMIASSLGFGISTSTQYKEYFRPSGTEYKIDIIALESQSSTHFNNLERFSLEQLRINKRKLASIERLPQNWNGYEGERFEKELIASVEKIISNLDYQPQIFPTGRGSIQLETELDEDNLVEIEVSQDEIFAYQVKDGIEVEKEISADEINNLISDLYV